MTRTNAKPREPPAITKPLVHLQAQHFCAPSAAQDAMAALAKHWTYHRLDSDHLSAHPHDAGNGRPTPCTPLTALTGQIQAHVRSDDETIEHDKHVKACCVLGTTIAAGAWHHVEVIAASKGQSHVEGGLRWLKEPLLVVSSLLVNKPTRIAGLLMVMTLALRVDAVAQRRLRKP